MKRIFLLYHHNLTTVTLINDEPHLQNEVSKNRFLLRTFLKPRYIKFTLKECETPKQNAQSYRTVSINLSRIYQDFSLTLQPIKRFNICIYTQQFMHLITIYRPSVSLIFTI